MKIRARITQVQEALHAQGTASKLHTDFTSAALNAIRGGITSAEWKEYMRLFADNEAQLKRLTGEDSSTEGYVKVASAYLVANGTCGGHSPMGLPLAFGVDERIDDDLPDQPDGTIVRKLII